MKNKNKNGEVKGSQKKEENNKLTTKISFFFLSVTLDLYLN